MPNFCIHYSYSSGDVVYHRTAIVRAYSVDAAKSKLVNFLTSRTDRADDSRVFSDFIFHKITVSNFNLVLS